MPTGRLLTALAIAAGCLGALVTGAAAAAPALPPSSGVPGFARVADRPPADPPLTAAQLAQIQKYIDKHGRKAVIDPDTSIGLGLGNAPVTVDQVSLRDKKGGGRHILDRLNDGSGFLVVRETRALRALYRVDKEMKLVKAVVVRLDAPAAAVSLPEAAQNVRKELQIWAAKVAGQP